jgi:hypothetical protein
MCKTRTPAAWNPLPQPQKRGRKNHMHTHRNNFLLSTYQSSGRQGNETTNMNQIIREKQTEKHHGIYCSRCTLGLFKKTYHQLIISSELRLKKICRGVSHLCWSFKFSKAPKLRTSPAASRTA